MNRKISKTLILIFVLAYFSTRCVSITIEILEPVNRSILPSTKLFNIRIRISGSAVGTDTIADLYFDGNLIGSLPENEVQYQIDGRELIGGHRVSVILTDMSDHVLGIEAHSTFEIVSKIEGSVSAQSPLENHLNCDSTKSQCRSPKSATAGYEGTRAEDFSDVRCVFYRSII